MPTERVPAELRREVVRRAQGCCEYCRSQSRFAMQPFSVEHIQPVSKGGRTTLDNLAHACQGCNNHKYNKTQGYDPISGQWVALFHPHQDHWDEHFIWNQDYTLIIGITPNGRATVEALKLNREGLVNLRRALYQIGEHPPVLSGRSR